MASQSLLDPDLDAPPPPPPPLSCMPLCQPGSSINQWAVYCSFVAAVLGVVTLKDLMKAVQMSCRATAFKYAEAKKPALQCYAFLLFTLSRMQALLHVLLHVVCMMPDCAI